MKLRCESHELLKIARVIHDFIQDGYRIFLFSGEVGSGKTTLIRCLGELLEIRSQVQSPTYGIVHQYESNLGAVQHSDWYRLKDIRELYEIGIHEDIEQDLWFIEWPEIGLSIAEKHPHIHISIQAPTNALETHRIYHIQQKS
jgi:tRNA threonylcarbamoyladenosine biosynthesis protein TsaE